MLMVLKKVAYEHSLINDRKECLVLGVMEVLRRCQDICISQTRCDARPLQPEEESHKAKKQDTKLFRAELFVRN